MYYYSGADVGNNILTKIERFIYETDVLPFKIAKGSLIENEELEMSDLMKE